MLSRGLCALGGLLAGGALIFACSQSVDSAPPLSQTGGLGDPITCAALTAAGTAAALAVPGPIPFAGTTAPCLVAGLVCTLPDTPAGVCDGGVEAAAPVASCVSSVWVGGCQALVPP